MKDNPIEKIKAPKKPSIELSISFIYFVFKKSNKLIIINENIQKAMDDSPL